jgi:CRISPR/Cas system-associated protein Cas10 (large subunit of type III CRISPR-Cas system)
MQFKKLQRQKKTKMCTVCGRRLSIVKFDLRRNGLCRMCKTCRSQYLYGWYRRDLDGNRKKQRNYILMCKYGLSPLDYQKLLKKQHHKCAICKRQKTLIIDHNHYTNTVRGLLCTRCNILLGAYEIICHNLVPFQKYLKQH